MNLLYYALGLFGLTYILGHSKITQSMRQWLGDRGELCVQCHRCSAWYPRRRWALENESGRLLCPECGTGINHDKANYRQPVPGLLWFVELLECPACLATHVGFWAALCVPQFIGWVIPELTTQPRIVSALALALVSAGINTILGHLTGIMRSQ